jgi:hypothetical protein
MKKALRPVKLTVDVYAHWSIRPPIYRVYVDNNLLTERDFIWSGTANYIRENIVVNLELGSHTLRVEQVNNTGSIKTDNITLNSQPSSADFILY